MKVGLPLDGQRQILVIQGRRWSASWRAEPPGVRGTTLRQAPWKSALSRREGRLYVRLGADQECRQGQSQSRRGRKREPQWGPRGPLRRL